MSKNKKPSLYGQEDWISEDDLLIQLLRKGVEYFNCIKDVVDICDPNMPVVSEDNNTILHTYLMLHGIFSNRHGEFDNVKRYNSFMERANSPDFWDCPEITGLVERVHRARVNLERAIREMKAGEITRLGYFPEEDTLSDRLVLYRQGE